MKTSSPEKKRVSELTFSDFVVHPVWIWAEDNEDESLVISLDYSEILPEEYDDLFVACKFTLHDGTEIPGVLAVNMSNRQVYLLSFPKADGGFFDFPLQPQLKGLVTREQLATWLRKPLADIFPITYSTSYVFRDGQPLTGQIE